jgi:hypothetical protein
MKPLLAAAALIAAATAAQAQAPAALAPPAELPAVAFEAPPLQRQAQAAQALKTWLVEAQKQGVALPRASDPGLAGRLIAAAFDRAAVVAAPEEPGPIAVLCNSGPELLALYLRDGVAAGAGSPARPLTRAEADKLNGNTVRFQPEEALAMGFTLDCTGRMVGLVTKSYAALSGDIRADAAHTANLRQLQALLMTQLAGGVNTVSSPVYEAPFRSSVLEALNRNAVQYAGALTLAQRGGLTDGLDQAVQGAPAEYQPGLRSLRATIGGAPCDGLCQY